LLLLFIPWLVILFLWSEYTPKYTRNCNFTSIIHFTDQAAFNYTNF
jgi:hypothetical protein